MPFETLPLFRDDAYRRDCEAKIVAHNERGGIVLDRTVFYATSGGQPGDTGRLVVAGGNIVPIAATVYGEDKVGIVHVPAGDRSAPRGRHAGPGRDRLGAAAPAHAHAHRAPPPLLADPLPRYRRARSAPRRAGSTSTSATPAPSTRTTLTEKLGALVAADHPVTSRWISDEELADNPGLIRTMSVKPPTGTGRVRLVSIGVDDAVDLQPCGGTHVRSTAEIGRVAVTKIEKKGRQNRRIRLAFAESA